MALFYDRDFGRNWHRGYDRGYRNEEGWGGFDREGMRGGGRYDRGFKSRWQTDYGDPFGDRAARTPMRMIRGEFRRPDDRGFGWGSGYERDYSSSPMGYDPYFDPSRRMSSMGHWNRYDRGYRGRGWGMGGRSERGERGERYDEGWF